MGDGAAKDLIYFISGMWCSTCARNVEQSVLGLDGVVSAQINYASKLLVVRPEANEGPNQLALDQCIQERVKIIGFGIARQTGDWILGFHESLKTEANQKITWIEISIIWFFAMWSTMFAFAGYLGDLTPDELHFLSVASALLGLPAILIGVRPYARSGVRALWFSRIFTLDFMIFLGALAVITITLTSLLNGGADSYADSGAMIIAILLLSKKIENAATAKITTNILFQIHPTKNRTLKFRKGNWQDADISQIRRDDLIHVSAGDTIPLDGTLESPTATSNSHLLNGENSRISLVKGDDVFAGTIACSPMDIRVLAPLGERRIDSWAEKALASTNSSGYYDGLFKKIESRLVTVAFSGATFLAIVAGLKGQAFWGVAESFFVGILVFCPCLFASILPLAKQIAYLALLKNGVLASRLDALLDLHSIRNFYFDKTGTLEAVESTYLPFVQNNSVPPFLGSLATRSRHVILRNLTGLNPDVSSPFELRKVEEVANQGIIGWDQNGIEMIAGRPEFLTQKGVPILRKLDPTSSYVSYDGILAGQILSKKLYDSNSAKFLIQFLNSVPGAELEILSGDPSPASGQKYELIDSHIQYRGNLAPEDKARYIKKNSAFIGDGLNDTLALAQAQVSFRLGQRVQAFAPVDFYLNAPDLNLILLILRYSRRYRRVLIQTAGFAIFYNVVTLSLAALGKFSPLGAAVAMLFSFTFMLLSVLRLQTVRGATT